MTFASHKEYKVDMDIKTYIALMTAIVVVGQVAFALLPYVIPHGG